MRPGSDGVRRLAGQRERGRQDVDQARGVGTNRRRQRCRGDDERHAQRRFEHQHAVRGLAVLAETFSVVAGGHDRRVGGIRARGHGGNEPPQLAIGTRDVLIGAQRRAYGACGS